MLRTTQNRHPPMHLNHCFDSVFGKKNRKHKTYRNAQTQPYPHPPVHRRHGGVPRADGSHQRSRPGAASGCEPQAPAPLCPSPVRHSPPLSSRKLIRRPEAASLNLSVAGASGIAYSRQCDTCQPAIDRSLARLFPINYSLHAYAFSRILDELLCFSCGQAIKLYVPSTK